MHGPRASSLVSACFMLLAATAAACSASRPEANPDLPPEIIIQLPTEAPTQPFRVDAAPTATSTPAPSNFENFSPENFQHPTVIDNPWLPLVPGTIMVYEGVREVNGQLVPHRREVVVSNVTKVIAGVRTVVTWEQELEAGQLVESELAFYAQDMVGNVWRMGEYPEEYDDGEYVGAPAWIAGIEGSVAGIEMPASPEPGMRSYSQGWAPSVELTDRAQVVGLGKPVCVSAGCYEDTLIIDETSEAEPDAHHFKYFARGLGLVKTDWNTPDRPPETLELKSVAVLNSIQEAGVRIKVLEQEGHAYLVSPNVYGRTRPSD